MAAEENEQVEVRRQKLQVLRERWHWDYPNDFRPDSTAAEINARFAGVGAQELEKSSEGGALAGRLVSVLRVGSAACSFLCYLGR